LRIALTMALVMLIAACTSTSRVSEPQQDGGAAIARVATQLIGTPYHFGGADLQGFDCSGLAVYSHERVGLEIPRTAAEQSRAARPVSLDALSPGDLLFFRIRARRVDHVGVYAGAGRFIHAPRSGEVVSYGSLDDPYYRRHFVGAGRFWSESGS
jgi:cell wall-associated NlpC family hydrolase